MGDDNEYASIIVRVYKTRSDFLEYLKEVLPEKEYSFKKLVNEISSNGVLSYQRQKILASHLEDFILKDFKDIAVRVEFHHGETFSLFPVGYATKSFQIRLYFKNKSQLNKLKLKNSQLLKDIIDD